MQNVIVKPADFRSATRSFSRLMDLYELNYLNLRRLLPDPVELGEEAVSTVRGGLDLHYRLLEQCKYTLIFSLTYHFNQSNGTYLAPDLQIKLYNDARVAEVLSGMLHIRHSSRSGIHNNAFYDEKNSPNAVFSRWRLNRFLYKWVNFCLKQGHVFREPITAQKTEDRLYAMMSRR